MAKASPVKGQRIFIAYMREEKRGRRESDIGFDAVVTRVGLKFFYIAKPDSPDRELTYRFCNSDWRHDAGNYTPRYQAYGQRSDFEGDVEASRLNDELRAYFGGFSGARPLLSRGKAKAIKAILQGPESMVGWQPFNYHNYECGIFWLVVETPDYDIDVDDYGNTIGEPTGKIIRKVVLAYVDDGYAEDAGLNKHPFPSFTPVAEHTLGDIGGDSRVTHFTEFRRPDLPEIDHA